MFSAKSHSIKKLIFSLFIIHIDTTYWQGVKLFNTANIVYCRRISIFFRILLYHMSIDYGHLEKNFSDNIEVYNDVFYVLSFLLLSFNI